MRRVLTAILLTVAYSGLHAQTWDINMGAGLAFTRLIPVDHSTSGTKYIHYGFFGPDIYLAPELRINTGEHSQFAFGFQFSDNRTGVKFRIDKSSGTQYTYESFTLQNFYVGYYGHRTMHNERVAIGWFGHIGIAYGSGTGGGDGLEGSSAIAGSPQSSSSVFTKRLTGNEVMSEFWLPNATLGFTIGPISAKKAIADRLNLSVSVTAGWRSIYNGYAQTQYSILTSQSLNEGIVSYLGFPLILEAGVSYRLFRFGHSDR